MKIRRVMAGLGAGVLVLVIGPAMATGNSYTVAVGGSSQPAQRQVTAASDGPIVFSMEKPDGTFLKMSCSTSSVRPSSGSVFSVGTNIVDVAAVDSFSFSTCTGIGGAPIFASSGTWKLHGTSPATSGASDTVGIHLENVTLHYSLAICQFTIVGGLDGSFSESTQKLTIDEKADGTGAEATVTNVSGCLGQVKNNGKFKFQGTFTTSVVGGSVNLLP